MHIPLVIALLALLALAALPILDRTAHLDSEAKVLRSYLVRIARWTKE